MKFTPHPILPELLALLDKYKASIRYSTADDGIHLWVDGSRENSGTEVFSGWACQDFGIDDLREAAAGCPALQPVASAIKWLSAMTTDPLVAQSKTCKTCSNWTRRILFDDMDGNGRGGACASPKVGIHGHGPFIGRFEDYDADMLVAPEDDLETALWVGEDFGCVHHTPLTPKP